MLASLPPDDDAPASSNLIANATTAADGVRTAAALQSAPLRAKYPVDPQLTASRTKKHGAVRPSSSHAPAPAQPQQPQQQHPQPSASSVDAILASFGIAPPPRPVRPATAGAGVTSRAQRSAARLSGGIPAAAAAATIAYASTVAPVPPAQAFGPSATLPLSRFTPSFGTATALKTGAVYADHSRNRPSSNYVRTEDPNETEAGARAAHTVSLLIPGSTLRPTSGYGRVQLKRRSSGGGTRPQTASAAAASSAGRGSHEIERPHPTHPVDLFHSNFNAPPPVAASDAVAPHLPAPPAPTAASATEEIPWWLLYSFPQAPVFRFVNLAATKGVIGRGGIVNNDSSQMAFVFASAGFNRNMHGENEHSDDEEEEEEEVRYSTKDGINVHFRATPQDAARLRAERASSRAIERCMRRAAEAGRRSDPDSGGDEVNPPPRFTLQFQTHLPSLFSLPDDAFYPSDGSACPSAEGMLHALSLQLSLLRGQTSGKVVHVGDLRLVRFAVESLMYSLKHAQAIIGRMEWSMHYVGISARGPLIVFMGQGGSGDSHVVLSCSAKQREENEDSQASSAQMAAGLPAGWMVNRSKLYSLHLPLDLTYAALRMAVDRLAPLPPTLGESVLDALDQWEKRFERRSPSRKQRRRASASTTDQHRNSTRSERPSTANSSTAASAAPPRGIIGASAYLDAHDRAMAASSDDALSLLVQEDDDRSPGPWDEPSTHAVATATTSPRRHVASAAPTTRSSGSSSAAAGSTLVDSSSSSGYFGFVPQDSVTVVRAVARPHTATARLQSPSHSGAASNFGSFASRTPMRTQLASGASEAAAAQSTRVDHGAPIASAGASGVTHEISYVSEQLLNSSYFESNRPSRTKRLEAEEKQGEDEPVHVFEPVRVRTGQEAVSSSSVIAGAGQSRVPKPLPSGCNASSGGARSARVSRPGSSTVGASMTKEQPRPQSPVLSFFGISADSAHTVAELSARLAKEAASGTLLKKGTPQRSPRRPQSAHVSRLDATDDDDDESDAEENAAFEQALPKRPVRPQSAHPSRAPRLRESTAATAETQRPPQAAERPHSAVDVSNALASSLALEDDSSPSHAAGPSASAAVDTDDQRPQSAFVRMLSGSRDVVISGRVASDECPSSANAQPRDEVGAEIADAADYDSLAAEDAQNEGDEYRDPLSLFDLSIAQAGSQCRQPQHGMGMAPLSFTNLVLEGRAGTGAAGGTQLPAPATPRITSVPAGHPLSFNRPMSFKEASSSLSAEVLDSPCARPGCGTRLQAALLAGMDLWRCVWCRNAVYCSSECIAGDWMAGSHQPVCATTQARLKQVELEAAARRAHEVEQPGEGGWIGVTAGPSSVSARESMAAHYRPVSARGTGTTNVSISAEQLFAMQQRQFQQEAEHDTALSNPASLANQMLLSGKFPPNPVYDIQRRARATSAKGGSRSNKKSAGSNASSDGLASARATGARFEEQQRAYALLHAELGVVVHESLASSSSASKDAAASYVASRPVSASSALRKATDATPPPDSIALLRGYTASLSAAPAPAMPSSNHLAPQRPQSATIASHRAHGSFRPSSPGRKLGGGGGVRARTKQVILSSVELEDAPLHYVPLAPATMLYATTRAPVRGGAGLEKRRPASAHARQTAARKATASADAARAETSARQAATDRFQASPLSPTHVAIPLVTFKQAMASARPAGSVRLASNGRTAMPQ